MLKDATIFNLTCITTFISNSMISELFTHKQMNTMFTANKSTSQKKDGVHFYLSLALPNTVVLNRKRTDSPNIADSMFIDCSLIERKINVSLWSFAFPCYLLKGFISR